MGETFNNSLSTLIFTPPKLTSILPSVALPQADVLLLLVFPTGTRRTKPLSKAGSDQRADSTEEMPGLTPDPEATAGGKDE